MEIQKLLREQIKIIKPSETDSENLSKISEDFCIELRENLKKAGIRAEVFVGGSVAKDTAVKKDKYDIDIFVRFDSKYNEKEISGLLGKVLGNKVKKVHGSRDYYQQDINEIVIEIVPVLKIKRQQDAKNVTDLSYFHVNYIVGKIKENPKLADEIRLAKTFAHANNCYGAESYIHGFSGYALELLVVSYGSFLNFIKAVAKAEVGTEYKSKIVIDDSKLYKNKKEILIEMNSSKLHSPIILVDPTFKERNAAAGLNYETFYKFKKACMGLIDNPSSNFFKKKEVIDDFIKFKEKLEIVNVRTSKQSGDIAGTKSKKFYEFFLNRLKKEFLIRKSGFDYDENENLAHFYLVLDKKGEETIRGPSVTQVENLTAFKKAHPNAFIKNHFAYAKITHSLSFSDWFKRFVRDDKKIIKDMSIIEVRKC